MPDMVTQDGQPSVPEPAAAASRLRAQGETLERRLRKRDEQRRAMIHIMGDLRETTAEMQRRELELRDKQEQLVQAGKLATLGELTTGVAHELNNPLNNTGLFVGNAVDLIELGVTDKGQIVRELRHALQQVGTA